MIIRTAGMLEIFKILYALAVKSAKSTKQRRWTCTHFSITIARFLSNSYMCTLEIDHGGFGTFSSDRHSLLYNFIGCKSYLRLKYSKYWRSFYLGTYKKSISWLMEGRCLYLLTLCSLLTENPMVDDLNSLFNF